MEEFKDMLGRLLHREEGKNGEADALKKEVDAIYRIYVGAIGAEELIVAAGKYGALPYLHAEDPKSRLIGLERLIMKSQDFNLPLPDEEVPLVMDTLEDHLADLLARKAVEEQLERKVARLLDTKHKEYVEKLRREVITEETGTVETPLTREKLDHLNKLDRVNITRTALSEVRPSKLSDVIGQEEAVKVVTARLSSPYPQHMIFYGPPGVGKTTVARLALMEARKTPYTVFAEDAPFVECDGTTLRWDDRDISNPLIGSVHDPIYQGAQKLLAEEGIPEPKTGLVTDAHGGVLFIDEIGELDPALLNKLLKVLEDKRVHFESAYYDEDNPHIPAYIKKLFRDGAPADFVLIGATTRKPSEINPAIRSRCAEVYFKPLLPESVAKIVKDAARRLLVHIEDGVPELVSEFTMEGRKAVNLLSDAYSLAVYEKQDTKDVVVTKELMMEVIRASRLAGREPLKDIDIPRVGHIYGLGVAGYFGETIEIEAAAYPASVKGHGTVHFNETAGSMTKDSVAVASSVVRAVTGHDISDYDIHINIVGGGNVDGPSAGTAITCALISAIEKIPLRQDLGVTGEISLSGEVKPVGGVVEKAFGAHEAGLKGLLIPEKNREDIGDHYFHMEIHPVKTINEVLNLMMIKK